jgi:dCMP deaminase
LSTIKSQEGWDKFWIEEAMHWASKSKDPSTKVGCVIIGPDNEILTGGFNGFPRGVDETIPERWERPAKYKWVEHAERNAVYNASRVGVSLKGSTAYLNWEPNASCADCSRAFAQAGVKEIVGPDIPFAGVGAGTHYHLDDCVTTMLAEAGVTMRVVPWSSD